MEGIVEVKCYKCSYCGEVYEDENEAISCSKNHFIKDTLDIIDCKYSKDSKYGFPELMQVVCINYSGIIAEYQLIQECSIEDLNGYIKAIDDIDY